MSDIDHGALKILRDAGFGPIEVGDRVTGRCVTMCRSYTGTVAAVLPDQRYKLVDTGRTYSTGGPVEPIVECAHHA